MAGSQYGKMSGLVFLLSLCLLSASANAALPKGWKTCRLSAADYEQCMIKAITDALKTLVGGDRSLRVLPIDPLRIDRIGIPKNPGAVSLDIIWTNGTVNGIKDLKITKFKNDWKKMEMVGTLPKLWGPSDYTVDGKVLLLPIVGNGKSNLTLVDVNLSAIITFEKKTKGGKEYFYMDSFKIALKPSRMYIHMTNLFNGDKALGDTMNAFLNENWAQILEEVQAPLQAAMSQGFTAIANRIFSKIPADELNLP